MNDVKLLAYVISKIKDEREDSELFVSSGRAPTYDEYRYVCGVIRGLARADEIVKDLVQRLEKNDD
jgi:hypothetical protein